MKSPLLSFPIFAALLGGCDQLPAQKTEYRPEAAGTVDHALCLLGFTAIPLKRLDTGHQLVAATLNGHAGNCVLDTGANVSVLHAPLASEFELSGKATGVGGAVGLGGAMRAARVPIRSLSLGPVAIRQRHIMTADLSQVVDLLGPIAGARIVGVIGEDVMREHRAVVDVSKPILHLIAQDRDPAPVEAARCARGGEGEAGNVDPRPAR